jgi:hypothetical protein
LNEKAVKPNTLSQRQMCNSKEHRELVILYLTLEHDRNMKLVINANSTKGKNRKIQRKDGDINLRRNRFLG